MLVTTTVGITPDTYEKTVKHKINRSKVCREALEKECERFEKETGERLEATTTAASPNGEAL